MPFFSPDPYTNKRYNMQSSYLKKHFGRKTVKISLNGGFTCPNIDGTKGSGGCIYCSSKGSGDFAGDPCMSIAAQFDEGKEKLSGKWGNELFYIPYFQANTNTYAPLDKLKRLYSEALAQENVVGLAVSTRPDCISEETADYLAELSRQTYLTVELGLQTIHDNTAQLINRCHTYKDFLHGYEMLEKRGVNICVHIINGLPFETREMMLETAKELGRLRPHAVKIHLLHVIRGTVLAEMFERNEFAEMDMDSYIETVCDQLEMLHPDTLIERLTGDGDKETLIAPLWSRDKKSVLNGIDKELRRRNSVQGCKYSGNMIV
ncbi:MAG: TIGR01212 family radical SAM protein [Oscillospiraceae bacterium]|nr:TIGR01212 family radical SAM protein [Oscillospiraceae bacterium]